MFIFHVFSIPKSWYSFFLGGDRKNGVKMKKIDQFIKAPQNQFFFKIDKEPSIIHRKRVK